MFYGTPFSTITLKHCQFVSRETMKTLSFLNSLITPYRLKEDFYTIVNISNYYLSITSMLYLC